MKKILFMLVAASVSMAAQAKILRVSNVAGSSAPYTSFDSAQADANEGDTIMLDASATSYGKVDIKKRLVILGPGYDLIRNGIVYEGADAACFSGGTRVSAEGTVLKGLRIINEGGGSLTLAANKIIVNRCYVSGLIYLRNASNSVIHQCYCHGVEGYGSDFQESFIQVTNSIITSRISVLHDSYVAYNTTYDCAPFACKNCTFEYNMNQREWNDTNNTYVNNLQTRAYVSVLNKTSPFDGDVKEVEIDEDTRGTYGAFAGDDPYVLAGIPSGPVIQDLIVPTTVEKGSTMSVTVKVGVVK